MEQVEKSGRLLLLEEKRYTHIYGIKETGVVLNDKNRYWSTANL